MRGKEGKGNVRTDPLVELGCLALALRERAGRREGPYRPGDELWCQSQCRRRRRGGRLSQDIIAHCGPRRRRRGDRDPERVREGREDRGERPHCSLRSFVVVVKEKCRLICGRTGGAAF